MKRGLFVLILAYVLSQFYRAFLPVLTVDLQADIGAAPSDLSFASGIWFLVFAAMQIPVGSALDRIGPRRTATALFAFGAGGGALVFALAQSPLHITLAMALIGVGCSPVLMAGYYLLARGFSARMFATLAGAMIGIGSLGNIAGSAPMAWTVAALGWRETMLGLGGLSLIVAVLIWVLVTDPERVESTEKGSVLDLLKMPVLWPIIAMVFVNYAPAAGIRGLWAGPYVADVFLSDAQTIGVVTLIMGLAMIAGNFLYGPLDRILGTRKWVIFVGNSIGLVALIGLILAPSRDLWVSTALLAAVGLGGSTYAVLIAHAKAFVPPHLTGRGVTLMNLFSIGGVGLAQFATGPIHTYGVTNWKQAHDPYVLIFIFFASVMALGLVAYLFSRDRTD
ncbi:Predicted arabinose efflux permease, MFS family [Cognatiyoonia koreensis]|uniref:Predicted arabinose efflux permease, MFS family n=1 Tax=Cognatiyoonia koreensis TaxID=364200 RepID=A0A1I0RED1_9RHOB|nr:MFS transporter [Cognatiyoonia koreensis]SEW39243.1 Predicted arabinose efflux permease, MFS family [Cognatiyoonia koreensis]